MGQGRLLPRWQAAARVAFAQQDATTMGWHPAATRWITCLPRVTTFFDWALPRFAGPAAGGYRKTRAELPADLNEKRI